MTRWRSSAAYLAGTLSFALGACEPCAGVAQCTSEPSVAIEGRIVRPDGEPATGVAVDFIVAATGDSTRAVTDEEGLFSVAAAAAATGDVFGALAVRPPGAAGYRVPSITVRATTRRGEAQVLPAWTTQPRLPDIAQIFQRGTPRVPLGGAAVEFRRTGGANATGVSLAPYATVTGADGSFLFFGGLATPLDAGDMVGDLTITTPGFTTVHRDVRIPVKTVFAAPAFLWQFGAGPNLDYIIQVNRRDAGPVAGVTVQFQRTDGVNITPASFAVTTDASGRFALPVQPGRSGVLYGDFRIVPPSPWKVQDSPGWALPTYDADTSRFLTTFSVGPALPYFVVIRNQGTPRAGVTVEFTRVSGLEVHPSRFTGVTNDTGKVQLIMQPPTEGEVVVDVAVRPPAPLAGFTVRGLRLSARDEDVPPGRLLLGDWDLASPPAGSIRIP